jgi:murein DD-endopeptidase MepM/ murein hydrolase activator NlpD
MRWALATLVVSVASAHADISVMNRQLAKGQNLTGALRSMGLEPAVVMRIVDAFDDVADLKRLREGQQLRVTRVNGVVENVDYRASQVDEYQAWRDGWRYVAARRAVSFVRQLRRYDLDVERSLWEAVEKRGHDPAVAMALADAFGWDLDMMRDARIGDRAKLLVETLSVHGKVVRLGDVIAARYDKVSGRRMEVFRFEQPNGDNGLYFKDGTSAQRTFMRSPAGWAPLTSRFGWRTHPIAKTPEFHDGVDYAMPIGTPVRAVASGLIVQAGYNGGGGNSVCVAHPDEYQSCYLHLTRIAPWVRLDAPVAARQIIGWSGNTGNTTAPHLHFSLKHSNQYVNPVRQHFARTAPLPNELLEDFHREAAMCSAMLDDAPVRVAPLR